MLVRGARNVLLALSLLAVPAFAGSADDPEIDDERGDVDVQHLVEADALEAGVSPEELEVSADILKAWIAKETEDSFMVHVEVADIPDEENVSSPLVEIWSHFTIRDGDFHVQARLAQPMEGAPVQASYALYLDETRIGELTGGVDVDADLVSFRVPKADVRDPGEEDELSGFYVTTHAPGSQATLDYAPGTEQANLLDPTDATSADPTDLDLSPTARYGDSYAFQSFEQQPSQITIDVTPASLEIQAGEPGTFAIRVTNDADEPDEASLSLSATPPGWSARLETSTLTVPAYGSETTKLHVTPPEEAEGHELLDIDVVTELGADKGASASVIAVQPEEKPTLGASDDAEPAGPDEASGDAEEPAQEADSIPAPSIAIVGVVSAALALLLPRRR